MKKKKRPWHARTGIKRKYRTMESITENHTLSKCEKASTYRFHVQEKISLHPAVVIVSSSEQLVSQGPTTPPSYPGLARRGRHPSRMRDEVDGA